MISGKVIVTNPSGFHLRPAGLLTKKATEFEASIKIKKENNIINAKSVIDVLSSSVYCGDEIMVECDGKDEKEALKGIMNLIESGLGE